MKLSAFRIKNYRAIIDTGWTKLAPDNITTLIGQNESGKTSILEALHSFYCSRIDEDILRSDLSLPFVACEFILSDEEVRIIGSLPDLPGRISQKIISSKKIHLNRKWTSKSESVFYYGDEELLKIYQNEEDEELRQEYELKEKVEEIIVDLTNLKELISNEEKEKAILSADISALENRKEKLEKFVIKTRNDRKLDAAQSELTELHDNLNQYQIRFGKVQNSLSKNLERLQSMDRISRYADKYNGLNLQYIKNEDKIKNLKQLIDEINEKLHFTGIEKTVTQLNTELNNYTEELNIALQSRKDFETSCRFTAKCFELALRGHQAADIESLAWDMLNLKSEESDPRKAGALLFRYLPDFKLFEDFSSLLPNKIDLEDILNLKLDVEGFNAARNFLIVSGLDSSFFRESNNRILKQKIENLNGEITLHFQGYWRQHLGRNNKIKLNFELEHYDLSHPEKKGKPYLEFWIKDDNERLYPKQRSRGVRWFLSFYLELKATSLDKDRKGKLLLIDEPGLSLHARAQEDVLKVFEDLKDDIQIVYSTHSPHLVNTDKLYRLLAVQRADECDDRSETRVFDVHSFSEVSGDTLSPIFTLLGTQISESNFIKERNNIILEDNAMFYYINTLFGIFEPERKIYFLPSTGIKNVPLLLNLLLGWKLDFGAMFCDNPDTQDVLNNVKEKVFFNNNAEMVRSMKILDGVPGVENLFSTIDFKKFILRKRIGITVSNLEFIESNNLNRIELASSFALHCQNNKITVEDFDDESRHNINKMINLVLSVMKN